MRPVSCAGLGRGRLTAAILLLAVVVGRGSHVARGQAGCDLLTTGRSLVSFPAGTDAAAVLRAGGARRVEALRPTLAVGDLGGRRPKGAVRVEPELVRPFTAEANDPLAAAQWALEVVHADQAAAHGNGAGVPVVLIDSGVDGTHPDLAGRVLAGADARYSPPRPLAAGVDSDLVGHGTAAAGIIAAARDNRLGIAGLAPEARIVPVVAGGGDGIGSAAFIRGLDWAVANGLRVVNLSFGGCGASTAERQAVDRARAAGTIIIAAVGNKVPGSPDPEVYPAAYNGVTGVAATTAGDGRAAYSVAGPLVDVAAPGGTAEQRPETDLVTTLASSPTCPSPCYGLVAGTSFAAPYVSAVVALVRAANPALAPADVLGVLSSTSVDLGPPGPDPEYGAGRVDANGAVALAAGARRAGRVEGTDRYGTAAALSAAANPAGAPVAYLARGDVFSPDALAGGPAAIVRSAPLLLTEQCRLPAATTAELRRLAAAEVVVLGGGGAVCDGVLAAVRSTLPAATVRRVEGEDRFGTAARLAMDSFPAGAPVAFLARGDGFSPDALVGGPVAGKVGAPILLAGTCGLPDVTRAAVEGLRVSRVVVLGGPAAVCDGVVAALSAGGVQVTRLAGGDRYSTAVAVAQSAWPQAAGGVVVARGDAFSPDALAAAPYAAKADWPLLLVGQCHVPPPPGNEVNRLDPASVVLAGGSGAICDTELNRLL